MNQQAPKIKRETFKIVAIPLFLILLCAATQYTGGYHWASLKIAATLEGEYWRIISSHFIHSDWQHYLMNMTGLSLCYAVFYKDMAAIHWIVSALAISIFSSIGLLIIYPLDHSYVGFSDVLHGWIMLGCTAIFAKETKLSLIVFILFWIKILEENLSLPFFTSFGVSGNVAKESHMLGAVGGLIYGFIAFGDLREKLKSLFIKKAHA